MEGRRMLIETQLPNLLHRGKVRDTYRLGEGLLLMISTDRISAFDVVLPNGIPDKGAVLNRLSAFWFERTGHLVPDHFIALADAWDGEGKALIASLPPGGARQAMVVKQAERVDMECIVRGYITGSAWSEYRRDGTVSGKPMPAGLVEGDLFPDPIFTPTTKAEEGHDMNMSDQEVLDMVGSDLARQLEDASKKVYAFAREFALERGIILADTKMEFGMIDGQLSLIDELLTPDSSRFWDLEGYRPGQSQPSFDKQFVRDWLTSQGWNQEPPAPELPDDIIARTSGRYLDAYSRLTGESLN
jgi:phosphoribosylaminoimidazole-succinocarboxamide synthase